MGNTSSAARSNEQGTRSRPISNVTRTFNALRRMVRGRTVHGGSRPESSDDFEGFERLLSEDDLANITSASDAPEHLITINVSYTQDQRECSLYVNVFNNSGNKVAEAVIYQDVAPNSETECFLSVMRPRSERVYNRRFKFPYSAIRIKAFLLKMSRAPPEEEA